MGAEINVPHAERGMAAGGPDFPIIALTVEEVARIAARVAAETPSTAQETGGAAESRP
ncbi:hypothetical protein KRMM14A1259_16890 [Krasilnikovia sp. MM14-A1259]